MIEEIMDFIHNYFEYKIVTGEFVVSSGVIEGIEILDGQYFKVVGSVFNNGVWKYPDENMVDEEFEGQIWLLAVPPRLEQLAIEIEAWNTENNAKLSSPFTSESFGGYSYTKATGVAGNGNSGALTWRDIFGSRLNQWRKLA